MEASYAYILLRLALGLSMLGHGLVRIPKLSVFSTWMLEAYEKSILPIVLVRPFSYVLPFVELSLGLLLLMGLFTRISLMGAGLVMLALIFGTCMLESWEWLPSQLIHILFVALLLTYIGNNTISVDQLLK